MNAFSSLHPSPLLNTPLLSHETQLEDAPRYHNNTTYNLAGAITPTTFDWESGVILPPNIAPGMSSVPSIILVLLRNPFFSHHFAASITGISPSLGGSSYRELPLGESGSLDTSHFENNWASPGLPTGVAHKLPSFAVSANRASSRSIPRSNSRFLFCQLELNWVGLRGVGKR